MHNQRKNCNEKQNIIRNTDRTGKSYKWFKWENWNTSEEDEEELGKEERRKFKKEEQKLKSFIDITLDSEVFWTATTGIAKVAMLAGIQLPKWNFKIFLGYTFEWNQFKETFEATIYQSTKLSNVVKVYISSKFFFVSFFLRFFAMVSSWHTNITLKHLLLLW